MADATRNETEIPVRAFGRLERETVIGPWTWPQIFVLVGGIAVGIIGATTGFILGYLIGILIAIPGFGWHNGRSWLRIGSSWIVWTLRKATKTNEWRAEQGDSDLIPDDWSVGLPGIGDTWKAYEHPDNQAAVLHDPNRDLISVVIELQFDEWSLLDTGTQMHRIAAMDQFTSALANAPTIDHVVQLMWTNSTDPTALIDAYRELHPDGDTSVPDVARQAIIDRLKASKQHSVERRMFLTVAGSIQKLSGGADASLHECTTALMHEIAGFEASLNEAGLTAWAYMGLPAWRCLIADMLDPTHAQARVRARQLAGTQLPDAQERYAKVHNLFNQISQLAVQYGAHDEDDFMAFRDPETGWRWDDLYEADRQAQQAVRHLIHATDGLDEHTPLAFSLDREVDHLEVDGNLHQLLWIPTFPTKATPWGFMQPLIIEPETIAVSLTIWAQDGAKGLKEIDNARNQRGIMQQINNKLQRQTTRDDMLSAQDMARREDDLAAGRADVKTVARIWVSGTTSDEVRKTRTKVTSKGGQAGWKPVIQVGRQWEEAMSMLPGLG